MNEKELLLEMWLETPKFSNHGPSPSTNWEMPAVQLYDAKEDWVWLLDFSGLNLKYS